MSDLERFHQALEQLLADQSPAPDLSALDEQEQRMIRMAQLLRGSTASVPRPEFITHLHDRLAPGRRRRVSRRGAVLSALGTLAAGIAAGFGVDHALHSSPTALPEPLVDGKGHWMPVANLADLPEGAIKAFTAGAVQGFLINRGGRVRALSRVCTHMGCLLRFSADEPAFVCPCHGAEFNLHGDLRYGPNKYGQTLPPLPSIEVRVKDQSIEVWAV